MALGKGLFDFIRKPNVFGGPDTYKNIVQTNGLNNRYSQYFQHHGTLPFEIFYDEKKEVYIYHFQVVGGDNSIIYDIVIEFTTKDPQLMDEATLRNYDVRFFSNSPGFAFMYAYVYNKYHILVPLLKDKFEGYLNTPPKKSNPKQAIGFDYTLYIAMRFLQLNSYLLNKSEVRIKGKPLLKFRHQDIATAAEAFASRSGADQNAFKKLANETKKTVKQTVGFIGKTIKGVVTSVTRSAKIKPKSATVKLVKSAKVSKTVKPRKKH